jgi:hypothetical protein
VIHGEPGDNGIAVLKVESGGQTRELGFEHAPGDGDGLLGAGGTSGELEKSGVVGGGCAGGRGCGHVRERVEGELAVEERVKRPGLSYRTGADGIGEVRGEIGG